MSKNKKVDYEKDKHPVSGLKVRRKEDAEVKVVLKPRKMELVKPKRQPTKVIDYANSALLIFPTDRLGITSEFKGALIRAASKVGTDEKNLELVKEVVDILMKHIEARFEQNTNQEPLKRRDSGEVSTEEVGEDLEDEKASRISENQLESPSEDKGKGKKTKKKTKGKK